MKSVPQTVIDHNQIALYLFDMGNVVIKNIQVLPQIIEKYDLPREDFIEDYRYYDFPMMDGTVTTPMYWKHVEEKFGIKVSGEPFEEFFKPVFNKPMVAVIERLKKHGKRVVAASNTFTPHYDPLVRDGFTSLFDAYYASHLIKISKPSRQFFEHILAKEGLTARQCLFVDDYRENIDGAQKLGITSLWYADSEDGTADEKLSRTFAAIK